MKFGVYIHKTNGSFAIAEKDVSYDWMIDTNQTKKHPLFNLKINCVQFGTGEYFFNKALKDYDYMGEL